MKMQFQALKYSDYRQLIRDALKFRGYSYRRFAQRHSEIVNFSLLGAALSAGRNGLKNKPVRNFSAETVTRIGKALRFSDEELIHLIFLKFENDAHSLPGIYGGSFSEIMKKMVASSREQNGKTSVLLKDEQYSLSTIGLAAAKVIDALPESAQAKVAAEILPAAKAVLSRQRKRPGVKTLSHTIDSLEELTN